MQMHIIAQAEDKNVVCGRNRHRLQKQGRADPIHD